MMPGWLHKQPFILYAALVFSSIVFFPQFLAGEEQSTKGQPDRYAVAMTVGKTYNPRGDIKFVLLSGVGLFDYGKVWGNNAPEQLRFKVELTAGTTSGPYTRFMTSANMFALYYLKGLETANFRPYAEGGIGLIYTDFQVQGQGLRFNFNPQMGLGTEYRCDGNVTWFSAIRLHHVSNGGFNHNNTGINSLTLSLGRFF